MDAPPGAADRAALVDRDLSETCAPPPDRARPHHGGATLPRPDDQRYPPRDAGRGVARLRGAGTTAHGVSLYARPVSDPARDYRWRGRAAVLFYLLRPR